MEVQTRIGPVQEYQHASNLAESETNAPVFPLTDRELAHVLLAELKRVAGEYTAAATEAADPQIRQEFERGLHRTLRDHDRLFRAMRQLGMTGPAAPASREAVRNETQRNGQTGRELHHWMDQWLAQLEHRDQRGIEMAPGGYQAPVQASGSRDSSDMQRPFGQERGQRPGTSAGHQAGQTVGGSQSCLTAGGLPGHEAAGRLHGRLTAGHVTAPFAGQAADQPGGYLAGQLIGRTSGQSADQPGSLSRNMSGNMAVPVYRQTRPSFLPAASPYGQPAIGSGQQTSMPACRPLMPVYRRQAESGGGLTPPEEKLGLASSRPTFAEGHPTRAAERTKIADEQPVIAAGRPNVAEQQPVLSAGQSKFAAKQPVFATEHSTFAEGQSEPATGKPKFTERQPEPAARRPVPDRIKPAQSRSATFMDGQAGPSYAKEQMPDRAGASKNVSQNNKSSSAKIVKPENLRNNELASKQLADDESAPANNRQPASRDQVEPSDSSEQQQTFPVTAREIRAAGIGDESAESSQPRPS